MSRCPHCQVALADEARSQGRCPSCGALLHTAPLRTVAGISLGALRDEAPTASEPPPSSASDTARTQRLDETLQTIQFDSASSLTPSSSGLAGPSLATPAPPGPAPEATTGAASSDAADDRWRTVGDDVVAGSVDEGGLPPTDGPRTVELYGDRTIDLSAAGAEALAPLTTGGRETIDSGIDLPQLTAQWSSTLSELPGVANVNATIRQQDTMTGKPQSSSSLVVKSRELRTRDEAPKFISSPENAPDYELLEVIGEGGMGVVYAARQSSIARTVAVKMLKGQGIGAAEQRDKFISEAVVTGELDHPNIVPIYDLGTNRDGALFYSMKRVKGTPWNKVIRDKSLDENLNILLRVADAVAFAHVNGVVHRDLKPENTMLGDYGEVLVMDWGLARICPEFPNAESVAQSASMGGTPAYMAPEMATGPVEKITAASDIYLLGAILHEIVTGVPPHKGDSVMACLFAAAKNQIVETGASGELYDIALKAMAADPVQRYASVKEFQEAIRQYQAHSESILLTAHAAENLRRAPEEDGYNLYARSVYGLEEALNLWPANVRAEQLLSTARLAYATRALRQGDFDLGASLLRADDPSHQELARELERSRRERQSRQRMVKTLKAAVVGLVASVLGIGAYAYVAVSQQRDEARSQRDRAVAAEAEAQQNFRTAVTQRQRAERNEEQANTNYRLAEQRRQEAEEQRQEADRQRQRAVSAQEAEQYAAYVARIGLTRAKVEENAFDTAAELLGQCPPELRHWEWGRLKWLCELSERTWSFAAPVSSVAAHPNGQQFATGDLDGQVAVWDPAQPAPLWQRACGQYVHQVAYDPRGARIAAASSDGAVRVYAADTGQLLVTCQGHEDAVRCVAFSPDGLLVASGGYDNSVRVWDAATGTPRAVLQRHAWWVDGVAFAPDGNRLVSAGHDGKVLVWQARAADATQWEPTAEFLEHRGPVVTAAFDPNGQTIVSAGQDGRVLQWRPDQASPIDLGKLLDGEQAAPVPFVEFVGHRGPVETVAFTPDGQSFATGGHDNLIIVWDVAKAAPRQRLRGHASHVRSVCYTADGTRILSAGRDQTVRAWAPARYAETRALRGDGSTDAVLAARFSRDGRQIVTAGRDQRARLWDAAKLAVVRDFAEGHAFLASNAVYFAEGSRLATSAGDGTVRLWDARTGGELEQFTHDGLSSALDVSADGRWLAAPGPDGAVRLVNLQTTEPLAPLVGHEAEVTAVRFASDGRQLASGDQRGVIRLWQLDEAADQWNAVLTLRGHSRAITSLAFLADDRRLLSASGDNTCGQWDLQTGQEIVAGVLRHPDWVADAVVTRDGRQALTCCDDGQLRLWQLEPVQLLRTLTPPAGEGALTSVDLSPDGEFAAAVRPADGTVYVWDVAAGRMLAEGDALATPAPWLDAGATRDLVWAARFGPDGRSLLVIGGSEATLLDLATRRLRVRYSPHAVVAAVALSPDASRVATGSWDRSAKIWDAASGKVLVKLDGLHQAAVRSVDFSPDGRQVLTGSDDGTARLWDALTGQPLPTTLEVTGTRLRQALFAPAGDLALTVSDDKLARLWDLTTGEVRQTFVGHAWGLRAGAFSPDGSRILTGGEDNVAIAWDAASGKPLCKLAGHTAAVTAVALSPDGKRALTGSDDALVKLWDVETGEELLTLTAHQEGVSAVAFSPDGLTVLTAGRDGQTLLWPAASWQAQPSPTVVTWIHDPQLP